MTKLVAFFCGLLFSAGLIVGGMNLRIFRYYWKLGSFFIDNYGRWTGCQCYWLPINTP